MCIIIVQLILDIVRVVLIVLNAKKKILHCAPCQDCQDIAL